MHYLIQLNELQHYLSPISQETLPPNLSSTLQHFYNNYSFNQQHLSVNQYLIDIIDSKAFNPFDSFLLWKDNADYYSLLDKLLINDSFLLNIPKNEFQHYAADIIEHLYSVAQYSVSFPKNKPISLSILDIHKENSYIHINDLDSLSLYLAASFRQDIKAIISINESFKDNILDLHKNDIIENDTSGYLSNMLHDSNIHIEDKNELCFNYYILQHFNISLFHRLDNLQPLGNSSQPFSQLFDFNAFITDIDNPITKDPKIQIIEKLNRSQQHVGQEVFLDIKNNLLTQELLEDKDFILQASKAHPYFALFIYKENLIQLKPLLDILKNDDKLLGFMWSSFSNNFGQATYNQYTPNPQEEASRLAQTDLVELISLNLHDSYHKIDFIELSQYLSPELVELISLKLHDSHFSKYQQSHFPQRTSSSSMREKFNDWGYEQPIRTNIDIGLEYNALYHKRLQFIEQKNADIAPIREIFIEFFSRDFENVLDNIHIQNYSSWPPIKDLDLTKEQQYQVYDYMLKSSANTPIYDLLDINPAFFDFTLAKDNAEKEIILERSHQYLLYITRFLRLNIPVQPADLFNTIPHLDNKEFLLEVFSSYFNSDIFKGEGKNYFQDYRITSKLYSQVLQKNPHFLYDTEICSTFVNVCPTFFQSYFIEQKTENNSINEERMLPLFKLTDQKLVINAIEKIKGFFNSPHLPRQWLTNYDCLFSTFTNSHTDRLLLQVEFTPQEIETIFSLNPNNQHYSSGETLITHCQQLYFSLPEHLRSVKEYAKAYISCAPNDIDIIPHHLFSLDSFCLHIIDHNSSLISKIPQYHWDNTYFISQACAILDNKKNPKEIKDTLIDFPQSFQKLFSYFEITKNFKEFFDSFALQQQLEYKTQEKSSVAKKKKI